MKKIAIIALMFVFTNSIVLSQTNPRMENQNYVWTVLNEQFNSLSMDIWDIHHNTLRDNLYIWVPGAPTVTFANGKLFLAMHYSPNYTTVNDAGQTITANFIAGEVMTDKDFTYGIFECNATFAYDKGSFPAFWLYNDTSCYSTSRPEIDIVECKANHSNPTLDNNIYYYYKDRCDTDDDAESNEFTEHNFTWGGSHTFKCIWSPSKIEFWVDNTLKKTVNNTGQYWYPNLRQHVVLSQQVTRFGIQINGEIWFESTNQIVTPQTSSFDWVKVREFFLAPEITCPPVICSSGTAVMDVDPRADSITWSLTPTNLFSGSKTGTGKNATITAASGASGEGKITYTFKMPSGEYFTAEKSFTVGVPNPEYIDFVNLGPNFPGSMVLCNDMPNDGKVKWNGAGDILEYSWSVYDDGGNTWQVEQHPMDPYPEIPMEDVQFSKPYGSVYGWVNVKVKARNQCSGWGEYKLPALQFSTSSCYSYYLNITPNPASSETVLTIENQSEVKSFDENAEWELEIYDSSQSLKEKNTKLKGKEHKLQTAGWKEGIYIIRVKYNNEILQGKLVVKK